MSISVTPEGLNKIEQFKDRIQLLGKRYEDALKVQEENSSCIVSQIQNAQAAGLSLGESVDQAKDLYRKSAVHRKEIQSIKNEAVACTAEVIVHEGERYHINECMQYVTLHFLLKQSRSSDSAEAYTLENFKDDLILHFGKKELGRIQETKKISLATKAMTWLGLARQNTTKQIEFVLSEPKK